MAKIDRHIPVGSRVSRRRNFGSEARCYGVTTGLPYKRQPGHYYVAVLWEGLTAPRDSHLNSLQVEEEPA